MSGYDSVNRNVSSRVRKVARDGADVTSGDRQFHTTRIRKLGKTKCSITHLHASLIRTFSPG